MELGPGQTIGGYEVVTRLRSGGMASLFLGRRRGAAGFSRPVVIKVIQPHLALDDDFVRMFIDEAKIAAQIDHPNVVHVEELGEANGMLYLVMEYVHGVSLGELAKAIAQRRRALTPELATAIAIRVADGLHGAHETRDERGELLQLVHRDVSPQNVLISYRGHIKLIDFGVAKARGRAQQTTGGSLKGKIRYMSPQQAFGHAVDRRADVYSLGVVLWELLTQRSLFKADNDMALLEMVRRPDVRPPSAFNAAVPPALDHAVMCALAPAVEQRTASAFELRTMLASAMPSAASLHPSQIADVVLAVFGDQIQHRAEVISESSPEMRLTSGPQPSLSDSQASQILHGATISVELSLPGISEPPSVPSLTPRPVSSSVSSASLEHGGARRPWRRAPVWAMGLLLVTTIGFGIGFALFGESTGEPVAPRPVPAQPAAALPPVEPAPAVEPEDAAPDPVDEVAAEPEAVAEVATAPDAGAPRRRRFPRMRGTARMAMTSSSMTTIPLAGEDEF